MSLITYSKTTSGLLLLSLMLSGCATTPDNPDPYEKFNRQVFKFNETVDQAVIKPVAKTYKTIVPEPLDMGLTNVFSNLNDITVVANDLLQLKFKQALSDAGRLFINSTIGLLGIFDVASDNHLPKHYEDFGQTLGVWGVNTGPYLILPLVGPSTVRDTYGWGVDFLLDPRTYYANSHGNNVRNFLFSTNTLRAIDIRADWLTAEEVVQTAATDKYAYIRNAYLQRREYLVYDGNPPKGPDTFDEDDLFDDLKDNDSSSTESPSAGEQ